MKKIFQRSLLYRDTGSLMYKVHSSNLGEELQSKELLEEFDVSNLPHAQPPFRYPQKDGQAQDERPV